MSEPAWRDVDEQPPPTFVRDRSGVTHRMGELLGSGGQGRVYQAEDSRRGVKLCYEHRSGVSQRLEERLARLRWLPLEDLPISRPLELLAEPHTGYTMQLLEGMVATTALCDPPEGELDRWYADGGGLRRRLRLLGRCAELLAKLHGRGIVYGDVSPGNVLVSESREHEQLWLVDADNLQVEGSLTGPPVQTKYYRAPELVCGHSTNTQFTDAYSFAVLAYQTVVADHPLFGDMVEDGPIEYQEDAERGLIPWVGHRNDDRNRSSAGIPPGRVLTRQLSDLFSRNFEDGMVQPRSRPSLGEWSAELHFAADITVACTGCSHTYYAPAPSCPWCGARRPEALLVMLSEQLPAGFGEQRDRPVLLDPMPHLVLQAGRPVAVTARAAQLAPEWLDTQVAILTWNGEEGISVHNVSARPLRCLSDDGRGQFLQPGKRGQFPVGWRLHLDGDERIHGVLKFGTPGSGGGGNAG